MSLYTALISPPAHRPRSPRPVTRTRETESSSRQALRASSMAPTMSWLSALISFGLLSSIRPTPLETEVMTESSAGCAEVSAISAHSCALARDDHAHDFVGAFQNLVDSQVTNQLLNSILCQISVSAVQLEGPIRDVETGVGRLELGHRGQERGAGIAGRVDIRGPPQEGASTFEVGLQLSDCEAPSMESGENGAEGLTLDQI